jgi:quercetin dioxygenase-like cupin family protein
MGQDNETRQRPHPAERFAAPEHRLDLPQLAAELRKEPLPTHLGHRQMTIYHHEPMAVVLFVFEQDGQLTDHQANGVVTIHLIEGAVQVTTAAHTYDLSPASMVALAPGVKHNVLAKQTSTILLTICLEPTEGGNG